MKIRNCFIATLCVLLWALTAASQVAALTPYSVSVFATSVPNLYTHPDSIAVLNGHVFVGYGNNVSTTGSDGKSSTIVEYAMNGDVIKTYSVLGHNDGLRVNPRTKQRWALQNEDANPSLVIIDPGTGTQTTYTFGPTPHGGGYDDMAFRNGDVFISASAPPNNPNVAPAIVKAEISGTSVTVSPVLLGNANATDVKTGRPVTLNLQDPDSMVFDPVGDLVLDSQSDAELIFVHHAGFTDQSVFRLGLTLDGKPAQVDDTVFVTSSKGVILVSDRDGETVYAMTKPLFGSGTAYSAAATSVGRLNLDTGVITPVVTGMVSPHGMAFVPK